MVALRAAQVGLQRHIEPVGLFGDCRCFDLRQVFVDEPVEAAGVLTQADVAEAWQLDMAAVSEFDGPGADPKRLSTTAFLLEPREPQPYAFAFALA